jgi:glutamate dehydrogenase/leucine dehydrogenase
MSDSIFDFMHGQGWTTLSLAQDRETGAIASMGGSEWSGAVDWPRVEQVTTTDWYATGEVIARLEQTGAIAHHERICELMRKGRHERIEFLLDREQDLRFFAGIHSTRLGPPAGGIRRHPRETAEIDLISDILNLGRGMSFKNAAAGVPNGGCKLGVHSSLPAAERDRRFYGFLAYCIDRTEAFTGPDMGFSPVDADRIREHTQNIVGGTADTGSGGATGIAAAFGVFLSIRVALEAAGLPGLAGLRVAVQGVGELGAPLVGHLLDAGASVSVADTSAAALDALDERATRIATDEILALECDVLAPCATGGILTEKTIAELGCKLVAGGANNQLAATSQEEERAMARLVADRGIILLPDWIVNAGGVIQGKLEHVRGPAFDLQQALDETERIVPTNVAQILAASADKGQTPTAAAYERLGRAVYGSR